MSQHSDAILAGMQVVEVSAFVAAPSGGMSLAQMGATVIKIDPPGGSLDYRRWPVIEHQPKGNDTSLFWAGNNKGKMSVAIDFSRPEGAELAQELICGRDPDAGILITNFPARGWLDYNTLKQKRADLIQLNIKGDRHGGSAVDYTVNPRLGLPFVTGPLDSEAVVNHVLPAWDLVTGQMAAASLLAAERYRSRSGRGQCLELALEDVGLWVMANLGFIAEAEQGVERTRAGNELYGAFGRDFCTADNRRVMVVGLTGKQWKALVRAFGVECELNELAESLGLDFRHEGDRYQARSAIADVFEPLIRALSFDSVKALLDEHRVCWGPYQTISQLVQNDAACSLENPLFSVVDQPGIGPTLTPSIPVRFGTGTLPALPAPRLGQHTESVLMDTLNLSSGQVATLVDGGIVGVG